MADTGISGVGVAAATAGALLMYAGIRDVPVLDTLRQVTSGTLPQGTPKEASAVSAARARLDTPGTSGGAGGSSALAAYAASGGNAWLAASALKYKGKPYVWAATGPDAFDCSGLVYRAFADNGISAPRTTYGQQPWKALTKISASAAAAGDLVFWPGHVAIVVAPGMVVHAPRPGKSVEVVPVGQAGPAGQSPTFKRYTGAQPGGAKQQQAAPPKTAWT